MKLETQCLHAGCSPAPTARACAVRIYPTASYVFKNTGHSAKLFALRELGNIHPRLMNLTHDLLDQALATAH